LFRRAVFALTLIVIPGFTWGVARADGKDAGGKQADSGVKGKGPAKPGKADKKGKKDKKLSRYAPVELYEINTKETLRLRFYDDKGMPIKRWQKRFNRFMRCHVTGTVFRMDSRLPHMLYKVGRHFEGHRLEVISGYRSPKVAKNPKSPHKQGVACDFRVPGIANSDLRDYLRKTFDHAGVGYYPNSVFVHLDNRKKGPSAFWIDYSGPGQPANYSENPREDLRNGRAEGADDVAQAGVMGQLRAMNSAGRKPVEIKAPQDTFGD
jgi:uncharacterized protein YcbK (DUF882 family)